MCNKLKDAACRIEIHMSESIKLEFDSNSPLVKRHKK
jgi:hypothetical protein